MYSRKKLVALRRSGGKVRLNIGAGNTIMPGFTNVQIDEFNMVKPAEWNKLLGGGEIAGVDFLFTEYVFEHVTPRQVLVTAAASFLLLRLAKLVSY